MTTRQLEQTTEDYSPFVPAGWEAIQVEATGTTWLEDVARVRCAVCDRKLDPSGQHKRITWHTGATVASGFLYRVQALVCRNGVKCRERALAAKRAA